MPGILEYQFMRGTTTDRDKTIARFLHNFHHRPNSPVGHRHEWNPCSPAQSYRALPGPVARGYAITLPC